MDIRMILHRLVLAVVAGLGVWGCGDDYDVCVDGSKPRELCTDRCRAADGGLSFCDEFPFDMGGDDDDADVGGDDDDDDDDDGDDDDDDVVVTTEGLCEPCMSSDECMEDEPDARCVAMRFEGEALPGGFCLRLFDPTMDGCPAPYGIVLTDRTLVGGDAPGSDAGPPEADGGAGGGDAGPDVDAGASPALRFCGLDEGTTTCAAVRDFLAAQTCQAATVADDCGVPGLRDAVCGEVDDQPGRCSYPCQVGEQCIGRCPGVGYCGGDEEDCPELAGMDGDPMDGPPDAGPPDDPEDGGAAEDGGETDPGDGATCSQETEEEDCGETSCDPETGTCTDTLRGSVQRCGDCVADSECINGTDRCVPMRFRSCARPTGYCLKPSEGGCERPFTVVTDERASLSGADPETYCGIDEDLTTCEAVLALQNEASCASDLDCGAPLLDDGICDFVNGDADRCTYACAEDLECDSPLRMCAGDPRPYCGGVP